MRTNGGTAALLALVVTGFLAAASPAAWADRLLSTRPMLDNSSSPQAYGGYITWLEWDQDPLQRPHAIVYHDGQVGELRLSANANRTWGTTPFDLGPDAHGSPVAAFAACDATRRRCAIRAYDLATDQERTMKSVRAPCGSISNVSIWEDTVAFVRDEPRRIRAGKVTCKYDESAGSPNSTLMTIRDRPRARPKLVKKYRARGGGYNPRSVSTVELSDRYVTWFSHISSDHAGIYLARVRDRRTLRTCTTGQGSWYRAEDLYGLTRPALLGEHIVWGTTASDTVTELFRQRGCGRSRERADQVGRLLDAGTFTYVKTSPETGYLNLYLSDRLPSFAPVS
jgi:hypothetical protein